MSFTLFLSKFTLFLFSLDKTINMSFYVVKTFGKKIIEKKYNAKPHPHHRWQPPLEHFGSSSSPSLQPQPRPHQQTHGTENHTITINHPTKSPPIPRTESLWWKSHHISHHWITTTTSPTHQITTTTSRLDDGKGEGQWRVKLERNGEGKGRKGGRRRGSVWVRVHVT